MNLAGEFRFAFRSLLKSPVFAAVAVLSLALGIGANTAVFTLLDQVLLRLLPVDHPEQIVQLAERGSFHGSNTGTNALSYPLYKDFSDQHQIFSGVLCRYNIPFSLSFNGRSERADGELVSGSYFPVFGIKPALGRLFTAEEDRTRGGSPVAVLGYGYWQNRFSGDPGVLGRQILVNNHQFTVIGVSAPGFEGIEALTSTQIFVPISMAEQLTQEKKPLDNRGRRWVQVFARLQPGVTMDQAKSYLEPVFHRILELELHDARFAHASSYTRAQYLKLRLLVMPGGRGQSEARELMQAPLWAMMAMVGLVLLIACANVANLIIARAASRQKEFAVRLALGASRGRIVAQLFLESLMLALSGGVLGLLLGAVTMRLLAGVLPQLDPPLHIQTNPDLRVLAFNFTVALLTALVFGLAPALQGTRPDLAPTLKDQANAVAGAGQASWRKLLVSAQVALSLLLLVGAFLFVGTLRNLKNLNPGFDVNNLLSLSVNPTLSGYDANRAKLFYRDLNRNVASLPGVNSAAICVVAPLRFDEWDSTVNVEGYIAKPGEDMNPWVNYVSPGFFKTLKIPLYAGRDFTDRDVLGSPKVAVVNEKFARHYFGSENPIGHRLGMGGDADAKADIEIVGVVRDTRYRNMREEPPRQVFFPYQQNDWATEMTLYVRSDLGSSQMFPVLRRTVQKLDANLPVYEVKTEERQLDDVLAVERLAATLSTAFGCLATFLAAIGLYGVMAFLVARRTREIGIRMALGALTGDVVWIVLREVLVLVGVGVAVGLPLALAVSQLLRKQLFGMSPADPWAIAFSVVGILGVAFASGYFPARRATRIDPLRALRYE